MKKRQKKIILRPDYKRVLLRPVSYGSEKRIKAIIARIQSLSSKDVKKQIQEIYKKFNTRHNNFKQFLLRRFEQISPFCPENAEYSQEQKLLIGAYFSHEYSIEAAALFNPSIVWNRDQSNLRGGKRRFILSLRATGEGHISSLVFRSGTIDKSAKIKIDKASTRISGPEIDKMPSFDKLMFKRKIKAENLDNPVSAKILANIPDSFTYQDLESGIDKINQQKHHRTKRDRDVLEKIRLLAESNYQINFSQNQGLSERVIFPHSHAEQNGIEDARFVQFYNDDGSWTYYATYTAYDGHKIRPQLLETPDFLNFRVYTLHGKEIYNKGLALFPRKINRQYAMISRQDNESVFIMFSKDLYFWSKKQKILHPLYPWEFVQLGNCSSPLETGYGWLVLSHGVGPMRTYSVGAFLLDKNDPAKVLGRLKKPILFAKGKDRNGYVPNTVYSCGGIIFRNNLIIPYALSDTASTFAVVKLNSLLKKMLK